MLTFVVMPCLNEENYVESAIESLLTAGNADPCATQLVAVDNGSTDGTLDILRDLGRRYPGQVSVIAEPKRGYVPPRHAGVQFAGSVAAVRRADPREVLILQADADTLYRDGYVAAMAAAAQSAGEGAFLEGATRRPADFAQDHPEYVRAERLIDEVLEGLEASDEDDLVVDDKVCGYRLSDYLSWGGLFEEIDPAGDQIHAETTRLFIRARLLADTRKVRVNPAGAAPSRRKIFEDPRYHFATMGFPRERSWAVGKQSIWSAIDVDEFAREVLAGREREAAFLRKAHLLALFRYLPAAILALKRKGEAPLLKERDVQAMLDMLPRLGADTVAAKPGLLVMEILKLIERQPGLFKHSP
jgi:glycosyltransferase involved in cell wall biosynthesis